MESPSTKILKGFLRFPRTITTKEEYLKTRKQGLLLRENSINLRTAHNLLQDTLTEKFNSRCFGSFDYISNMEEEDQDYENLIVQLKKMKKYFHTVIAFRGNRYLSNYTMRNLCSAMYTNKSLKSFETRFIECFKLQDEGFSKLGKVFLKQKRLTRIDCYFYCLMHITEKGFARLGGYLTWVRNLKDLELYFGDYAREWQHITDQAIVRFLGYISKLDRLERLKLTMHGFRNMSDESLFGYYDYFRKLKNLKRLELLFRHRNMFTENGIAKIAKLVSELQNLEFLNLDFRLSDYPGHKGFVAISDALEKLPKLRVLKLHFEKCLGIQTQSLEYFSSKIISLTGLEKLQLNFPRCENITNIVSIGRPLSQLKNLRIFEIDITECRRLTDPILIEFLNLLKGLTQLTTLALTLYNLEKTKGQILQPLLTLLSTFHDLRELNLGIGGFEIDHESLNAFLALSKDLKELKEYKLEITPEDGIIMENLDARNLSVSFKPPYVTEIKKEEPTTETKGQNNDDMSSLFE